MNTESATRLPFTNYFPRHSYVYVSAVPLVKFDCLSPLSSQPEYLHLLRTAEGLIKGATGWRSLLKRG